jgi:hypothetical protein
LTTTISTTTVHAFSDSTDINTNSTVFVNTSTTLTFTSTKTNLLVAFSISGYTDQSAGPTMQGVTARVIIDGTRSLGGTSCAGLAADALGNQWGDFNLSFSRYVTMPAGTHTVTVQWLVNPVTTATHIYSPAATLPDYYHRTISVIEY